MGLQKKRNIRYRKKRVRRSDGVMTSVYVLRKTTKIRKRKNKFGIKKRYLF